MTRPLSVTAAYELPPRAISESLLPDPPMSDTFPPSATRESLFPDPPTKLTFPPTSTRESGSGFAGGSADCHTNTASP